MITEYLDIEISLRSFDEQIVKFGLSVLDKMNKDGIPRYILLDFIDLLKGIEANKLANVIWENTICVGALAINTLRINKEILDFLCDVYGV